MGYWAGKKKLASSVEVKRTLVHRYFQTTVTSQKPPKQTAKKPIQFFQSPFIYPKNIHEHSHAFLYSKPSPLLARVCPLFTLSSSSCSRTFQPFDVLPQRRQFPGTINFYDVLDLIRLSSRKPNSVTTTLVHSLALKVGALAHLHASTSLMIAYSRAQCYSSSIALFREVPCKDVIIWNAMMSVAIENMYFSDARGFLVEMHEEGREFDSTTLVIAISALSYSRNIRLIQGRILHGLSMKTGMLFDTCLSNALIDLYAKCNDLSSSEHVFVEIGLKDNISWNSMISGCLTNNSPEKSLWYFKQMACYGIQADNVSLSCAIAASTSLENLGVGQVFQGWGIKLGYEESSHNSVANSLISLYSQCGDIDAAGIVFKRIFPKDLISWNAMIDGYVSSGRIIEAFNFLHKMQVIGSIQPDRVTMVTLLPVCAELMLLREGKAIHGFTARRNHGLDLSVMNSLMDMYLKSSSVTAAENLFKTIPEKDLISWNTMISGYAHNGLSREAHIFFRDLLRRCSQCTLTTVLAVLPSCDSPELLHFGKSLHCWQLKLGFLKHIVAINSLMFMYLNCGDLVASAVLLLKNLDIADTACWNTLVTGYVQYGYFLKALETFNLMRLQSNATNDSITLQSVLSACGNLGLVKLGKLAHGIAVKTLAPTDTHVQNALITMYGRFEEVDDAIVAFNLCYERNLCSWNCMISALSQNKDSKRALELFHYLGFEPNEITISTILSACTQLGIIRHGKQIHGYVFRSGLNENPFITAALVDMYSNCGRLDIGICIFQLSPEKSVATWNSMISAYGFHSNGQKAVEVFDEMIDSGANPTKTTFINLLSSCSHSGLIHEGLWYYDRMLDHYCVQPVTEHHVCIVDMLGRSGRLIDAYEFIMKIPTQPEPGVWGAMLSACNYHGNLEMGRKVADILFSSEPENVGYYISLSNMYVAAGRWSDVADLRTIVQDKQLKKPAGYSLIDVGLG